MLHLVVFSGSLGSLISLFVGLSIICLNFRKPNVNDIIIVLVSIPIVAYALNYFDFEFLSGRLNDFLATGNTSGRTDIWSTNINHILNYPVLGIGPLSELRTSHNMFVDAFVWGGMLGLITYFLFVLLVLKNTYFNYKLNNDFFYMAVFAVLLIMLLKSGGAFKIKYIWLFLAIVSTLPVGKVDKEQL